MLARHVFLVFTVLIALTACKPRKNNASTKGASPAGAGSLENSLWRVDLDDPKLGKHSRYFDGHIGGSWLDALIKFNQVIGKPGLPSLDIKTLYDSAASTFGPENTAYVVYANSQAAQPVSVAYPRAVIAGEGVNGAEFYGITTKPGHQEFEALIYNNESNRFEMILVHPAPFGPDQGTYSATSARPTCIGCHITEAPALTPGPNRQPNSYTITSRYDSSVKDGKQISDYYFNEASNAIKGPHGGALIFGTAATSGAKRKYEDNNVEYERMVISSQWVMFYRNNYCKGNLDASTLDFVFDKVKLTAVTKFLDSAAQPNQQPPQEMKVLCLGLTSSDLKYILTLMNNQEKWNASVGAVKAALPALPGPNVTYFAFRKELLSKLGADQEQYLKYVVSPYAEDSAPIPQLTYGEDLVKRVNADGSLSQQHKNALIGLDIMCSTCHAYLTIDGQRTETGKSGIDKLSSEGKRLRYDSTVNFKEFLLQNIVCSNENLKTRPASGNYEASAERDRVRTAEGATLRTFGGVAADPSYNGSSSLRTLNPSDFPGRLYSVATERNHPMMPPPHFWRFIKEDNKILSKKIGEDLRGCILGGKG